MFSHLNQRNQPRMVDVGAKEVTARTAHAMAVVHLPAKLASLLQDDEIVGPKGAIFQTATLAGVMAVKRTSTLIPLCHPLPIDHCEIELHPQPPQPDGSVEVEVHCRVGVTARTGVEMEALTGATIAALTLYDMGKAVTHDIMIRHVRLMQKTGGKSDHEVTAETSPRKS